MWNFPIWPKFVDQCVQSPQALAFVVELYDKKMAHEPKVFLLTSRICPIKKGNTRF